MKKGAIVSILLVMIFVSAYFMSSTYAKYNSEFKGTDSARVAEWKFNYINEADLFSTLYDTENTIFKPGVGAVPQNVENDVATGKIAPGSYGEYKFTISGTAETSYKLKFDFTGSEDNTGGRITYYLDGVECGNSIEDLTNVINNNFVNRVFKPGEQPGHFIDTDDNSIHNDPLVHTISVVWDYEKLTNEKGDSLSKEEIDAFNAKDTELGIKAARNEEIIVKLVAKIIVTQVD